MGISWLFLAAALGGAWFTWNAHRPIYRPAGLATVSFFAGWLTTELAVHHIIWQLVFTVLFVWAGALAAWPGWVALAIVGLSWVGLARMFANARTAEHVVERALAAGLGDDYRERVMPGVQERLAPEIDWRRILLPFPMSHPEVERVLTEHPAVLDAAAVGEEVGPGKVVVAAWVVARPESGLDADALLAYGRSRLASYKAPKIVYLVDEFPRTRNGKLQRQALTPRNARARSTGI